MYFTKDVINMNHTTITAISTAIGGGIAIIRLSGADAVSIAKALFKPKGKCAFESHRMYYGHIIKDERVLDECMLTIMKAPRSYTKEDVVEISFHGGMKSAELVLNAVIDEGAVLAEPGEFTKRAFLNGRIDLVSAQAVIDIINSKTELSHNQALGRLSGRLSGTIMEIRESLLDLLAAIEASIDYPEYDTDEDDPRNCRKTLETAKVQIQGLIERGKVGIIISEGLKTVILGRPNVGKSSLLNRILGTERAIVTDIPGTTRDILTETISVRGIPLNIADTAGLRDSEDLVENIGITKSLEHAADADLVLYVLDGSREIEPADIDNLNKLKGKQVVLVLNKSDLGRGLDVSQFIGAPHVFVSASENMGINDLYDTIYGMFLDERVSIENTALIGNTRDMNSLKKAFEHVNGALETMSAGFSEDMAAIDIMDAYVNLGQILGESLEDDVVDRIFSKFCLGK